MAQQSPAGACELDLLQDAFRSFDQAAATLQESYQTLTARLERMDLELAASNEALRLNLKENEEMRSHLSAILESLTTGVIVADGAGAIVRCNRSAEVLLGLSRNRLFGRPISAVLAEYLPDGGGHPIAPNGIPLSLSRAVLRNSAGEATGAILLLHDISAVRRLEERLQRRDRLASMGEMVGRIAHEIRNPLGSVELFASLLRRDLREDPARRQYAEHISKAVEAMDRLLSNLLVCTKPNCPNAGWQRTDLLVQEALALAQHATLRGNVAVQVHLDPAIPTLWCDGGQLKQVLVNLVLNAAQAMPGGGTLTLKAGPDREGGSGQPVVRLSVSDQGEGIRSDHRSRLFDPFFTTKEEGTGLGLAIVHAIVEGHRGRVEVESEVGRGSTFSVILPQPENAEPSAISVQPQRRS